VEVAATRAAEGLWRWAKRFAGIVERMPGAAALVAHAGPSAATVAALTGMQKGVRDSYTPKRGERYRGTFYRRVRTFHATGPTPAAYAAFYAALEMAINEHNEAALASGGR
jgi:hypothetical protein